MSESFVNKPKTFQELKSQGKTPERCKRCNQKRATHSMSVTVVKRGEGRAGMEAQLRQIPVCETCGVEVFAVVKTALKQ